MRQRYWLGGLLGAALGLAGVWGRPLPAPTVLQAAPTAGWIQSTAAGGQAAVALAGNQESIPRLYAGTITTTLEGGLSVSTNGGATWTTPLTVPIASAATSLVTPTLAYAGGFFDGFWSSTDGTTWTPNNAGLLSSFVGAILPVTGARIFAGTDYMSMGAESAVFLSEDGGDSWFPTGPGIPPGAVVQALALDGDVVVAGTTTGAFRTLDMGSSWLDANTGLAATSVFSLLKAGQVLHAATDTGVFTSTTQGDTWTATGASLTMTETHALAASHRVPRVLIAGRSNGVFISSDHGATWQPGIAPGLEGIAQYVSALVTTGDPFETVFAATGAGVWKLSSLFELGCAALPDAAFGTDPAILDASDLATAATHWHGAYNPSFDLDEDGAQTIADIMRSAAVFGSTCPL